MLAKFSLTRLTKFPKPSSCLWKTCYYGLAPSEFNRYRITCSNLQFRVIPAANLLLELYLKSYVWKELQSSTQTYLQSKTPQYNNDREKQFSSLQLVWMTTQALYARVRYL